MPKTKGYNRTISCGTLRKILCLQKGKRIKVRYFDEKNPEKIVTKILLCEKEK